jgi:predicted DNA-binding protein (MmcQ/YjbR family)
MCEKWAERSSRSAAGRGDGATVTFMVSDVAYEMLRGKPGFRPAPHLASRGLKGIQLFEKPGLSDDDLRGYLRPSN